MGDTVALGTVVPRDAIGEITGPLLDGRIQCYVVSASFGPTDTHIAVTEDQLLMRVREVTEDARL